MFQISTVAHSIHTIATVSADNYEAAMHLFKQFKRTYEQGLLSCVMLTNDEGTIIACVGSVLH